MIIFRMVALFSIESELISAPIQKSRKTLLEYIFTSAWGTDFRSRSFVPSCQGIPKKKKKCDVV
jgi:hypothetical protein